MATVERCPGCDAVGGRALFRGSPVNGFAIRRCSTCALVFSAPRPTPAQLDEVYVSSYLASGGSITGYRSYNELPEAQARRSWHDLRSYAFDLLPAVGRVLDIGCATGGFLAEAQASGWTVRGTDYSTEAATRAAEVNGVAVEAPTLLPADDAGAPFDLVTMWHVLEHLVELRETVDQLAGLVAPDGLLVIEVPNWDSVGRLVRGRSWSQLRPPEHINFFTPRSLTGLIERAGFRVVRRSTRYPSLLDRSERHGAPRDRVASALGAVAAEAGWGGYLRIVATPG